MNESHKTLYSGHLGYQKMITMIRKSFFWTNMKNEFVEYLARCIEFQQVKYERNYQIVTAITYCGMEMGDY